MSWRIRWFCRSPCPTTALARREGIKWRDSAGDALARRVDPSATYLGPSYERALFRYYWSLWLRAPAEMAALYVWKFDIAGYNLVRPCRKTLARSGSRPFHG
jgi:hypothetical protein